MGIAYNTSIVRSGLVLHLDAANQKSYPGTGTAFNDMSGKGKNSSLVNGASYANNGINLDGVDDHIAVTMPNPFAETIIVWAKSNTANWNEYGWITSSRTQNGHIIHPNINAKTVDFFVFDQSSSYVYMGQYTVADVTIPHMYSYSTNGSNLHKAYLDGTYKLQSSTAVTRTANLGNQVTQFGRDYNMSRYGNGVIYSVIRYDRQLSDDEIAQNFEAYRGRYGI